MNRILMMGSCFSTEVGKLMQEDGWDVCLNPFGILFNPASICSSLLRLESCKPFCGEDVIERDGKYVSFFHHGSKARISKEEFLADANAALAEASERFDGADTVILTFGTAWVFRHLGRGYVVSNCHKVPAREFERVFMPVEEIVSLLGPIFARHTDKRFVLTVSPIRHPADGIHGNQLSKSTLIVAADRLAAAHSNVEYFESYEIMTDTLRDHSWYRENGTHPTDDAVRCIYAAFLEFARRR